MGQMRETDCSPEFATGTIKVDLHGFSTPAKLRPGQAKDAPICYISTGLCVSNSYSVSASPFCSTAIHAVAVNTTSVELFKAVFHRVLNHTDNEANSDYLYGDIVRNAEQAACQGNQKREPPATPDAPKAETTVTILRISAVAISTWIPSVFAAARVITVIVIAAPPY